LLAYARVYCDLIMMDALRRLLVRSEASAAAKGKALGYMLWSMVRALRRMGWRKWFKNQKPES
jgi:hypothetical protein